MVAEAVGAEVEAVEVESDDSRQAEVAVADDRCQVARAVYRPGVLRDQSTLPAIAVAADNLRLAVARPNAAARDNHPRSAATNDRAATDSAAFLAATTGRAAPAKYRAAATAAARDFWTNTAVVAAKPARRLAVSLPLLRLVMQP